MSSNIDLTGQTAIVTGGGKGIGRTLTTRLLDAGAEVVVCGRSAPETPPSAGGRTALFVQADLREPDQIQRVVDATVEAHGRIDILINNAGGTGSVDTAMVSPRYHAGIIALNLTAVLNMSCAAYRQMSAQDGVGSIVNISSVAGLTSSPRSVAYAAAKAGVTNLTRSLAIEWAPAVRINTIIAGLILIGGQEEHYGSDGGASVAATIPMGRMGRPDDLADACLMLCSPFASWVTGANWEIHGGGERPVYQAAAGIA